MGISFVTVTYNSAAALERALPPLLDQLGPEDELIVVDNASSDGTVALVAERWPACRLIETGANVGFAAACNRGAEAARGEVLVFINPDAAPAAGFVEALRMAPAGWDAWMALVTMDDGSRVNTSGGVVHFTGIAWAGQVAEPISHTAAQPHEVGFVSGACFAVRREAWDRAGGFSEPFFMYCEDVDLSLRLRLAGGRIGIVPDARVDHDYEFHKRPAKWRLLERNRLATVLRTYPTPVLIAVSPALIATELALLPVAALGGWLGQKLLATIDTLRALPRLMRERRQIQATRTITAAEFARHLTADLSSPYLGAATRLPLIQPLLSVYWRCARRLLDR